MRISLCIPTYEMHGIGVQMLERSFEALEQQTFTDFEVVISDNSENKAVENLCRLDWDLDIAYFKNPKKGMAINTNYALEMAVGELIKILYQDDYLADENSLFDIANAFTEDVNWLVTGCSDNPHPYYREDANTIGSPSVLTLRNKDPLLFNENYSWVLDLDLYRRLYSKFGTPKILDKVGVIMGLGSHQHTNHLSDEQKNEEYTSLETNNR